MTDIKKIGQGLPEVSQTKKAPAAKAPTDAFEAKLQKTLEELETMGSKIDALVSTEAKDLSKGVDQLGNMIQSMKGLVENFSASPKPGSAKFVASQYEKANKGKES
jgi:hypothetical protein